MKKQTKMWLIKAEKGLHQKAKINAAVAGIGLGKYIQNIIAPQIEADYKEGERK